jgi:hypothetical protein
MRPLTMARVHLGRRSNLGLLAPQLKPCPNTHADEDGDRNHRSCQDDQCQQLSSSNSAAQKPRP